MSGPYHINKYPLERHEGVDLAQRASARTDALVKALEQILAGSRNDQITNAEFRVKAAQTAHGILGDVGAVRHD